MRYTSILKWRNWVWTKVVVATCFLPLYNFCVVLYVNHMSVWLNVTWLLYVLEEITTSQWRFCQLWNLVVCNWGFRPSWSTISVTSLVRLLFWLIPYICTGEQSFRCVSLWPYSAGTFQKDQRSTTCVRRTLFLFLLWLFFNFNEWEKTRFVCNAI